MSDLVLNGFTSVRPFDSTCMLLLWLKLRQVQFPRRTRLAFSYRLSPTKVVSFDTDTLYINGMALYHASHPISRFAMHNTYVVLDNIKVQF